MQHRIGSIRIDVDFEIVKPWTILFGPSGSGKTTILRAIAGLLRPDLGKIVIGRGGHVESTLFDSEAETWVPAHQRGMPLAPQRPSLFPHLSVLQNIRYGVVETPTTTTLFEASHLQQKRPAELSGGEAQRVNVARAAMRSESRLLLLDEPFTGLDLPLRDQLMGDLLVWQKERRVPILSVTHDVAEAFFLDAQIIELAEGRIVEQGPVVEVLAKERARLVAQLSPRSNGI